MNNQGDYEQHPPPVFPDDPTILDLFFWLPLSGFTIPGVRTEVFCAVFGSFLAIATNSSFTFAPDFADVSINNIPFSSQKLWDS